MWSTTRARPLLLGFLLTYSSSLPQDHPSCWDLLRYVKKLSVLSLSNEDNMLYAENHMQPPPPPKNCSMRLSILNVKYSKRLKTFLIWASSGPGWPTGHMILRTYIKFKFSLFFYILGVAVHHFDEAHLPHWLPWSRVPFRRQRIWYRVKRSGKPGFLLSAPPALKILLPSQKRKVHQLFLSYHSEANKKYENDIVVNQIDLCQNAFSGCTKIAHFSASRFKWRRSETQRSTLAPCWSEQSQNTFRRPTTSQLGAQLKTFLRSWLSVQENFWRFGLFSSRTKLINFYTV